MSDLRITYGTSRGRQTYGYNLVTLTDLATGKRYTCKGGGYDMRGTVLAEWLQDVHQADLQAIAGQAFYERIEGEPGIRNEKGLYGMTARYTSNPIRTTVTLDGGCGWESMRTIANAIGLTLRTIDAGKTADVIVVESL